MYPKSLFVCLSALSIATSFVEAATPGLLMVKSKPNHSDLTDAVFNDWYTNEHIHDMANSGLTDLVVRYKNLDPNATWPYLAIYRVPDMAKMSDPKIMGSVPATSSKLPGKEKGSKGGAYVDVVKMEPAAFIRTQTFEGQGKKTGRGSGLMTAAMQPKNGTEADFDDWYRKQHLDMLGMVKGYRRSTRYEKADKSAPRYLAFHEFDTTAMSPDLPMVLNTEWSKKVMSSLSAAQMDSWGYISEFGKVPVGEPF